MRKHLLIASLTLASCGNLGERESLRSRLAPGKGEVVWRISERTPYGTENRSCFDIAHGGAITYWPSKHTISFTLSQNGQRKTLTSTFASKPEHEVVFYWNQTSENIGLSVDGKPAQEFKTGPAAREPLTCPF